jgi:PAS domain-containing protein
MEAPQADGPPDDFRWQALFQRTAEPLFLLNRRRRILFVNRAWEQLTGLSARAARGLPCKRRPRDAATDWSEFVQNALAPPPEVVDGKMAQCRRLLPADDKHAGPQWWQVTFLPFRDAAGLAGILGKIAVVPQEGLFSNPPVPERFIAVRDRLTQHFSLGSIASEVPVMRRVLEQVRLAGQTRMPVLLTGETGTGKYWLARVIHQHGPGRDKPFVRIDCPRLPAAVLEGMFGAASTFRLPAAGSIYLREVQQLPRELQERLCRWIPAQSESGPRVLAGLTGGAEEEHRILPALHCLLSPLTIRMPPLRERLADLPRLLDILRDRAGHAAENAVQSLSADATDVLRSYAWPENLRELYQVLTSACAHAKSERIEVGALPFFVRSAPLPAERVLPLDSLLEQVERRLIALALRAAQNNRSRAAEMLSIWRPRLIRRLEALGIKPAAEPPAPTGGENTPA